MGCFFIVSPVAAVVTLVEHNLIVFNACSQGLIEFHTQGELWKAVNVQ
jgi:hypothetical protein